MRDILTRPLTKAQLEKAIDNKDNRISAIIPVELSELIGNDIETLNDLAQDRIIGDGNVFLTDIGYHVAGSIAPRVENDALWTEGTVLLGVTAMLEPSD